MQDTTLHNLITAEAERQRGGLELIPSENYASKAILEALGSVLTNKYSEGYPGKRYYGGQEFTDQIEQLAIDRARELFGADHANVQPHSGAQANEALYHAWLEPGDTVLAMDLSHGGHLTHGHPVTVLSRQYNFIRYKMSNIETGEFDFEEIRALALREKPKILLVGFSSFPRELDYAEFAKIGHEVGALLVADIAHLSGMIAGKVLKNPLEYGFHVLTSTTHKSLRGPRGGMILSKGMVSNPLKTPEKTIDNIPTLIDRTVFPGMQGGPLMNNVAAKAVCFYEAMQPEFHEYAKQVITNARTLAQNLMDKNYKLITNGTDNHLMLVDCVKSRGLNGAEAEKLLDSVGLTLNKNVIPDDPLPPFSPSGIRLGTPAITTRGANEDDMTLLAGWIDKVLSNPTQTNIHEEVKNEVRKFALSKPLPSD